MLWRKIYENLILNNVMDKNVTFLQLYHFYRYYLNSQSFTFQKLQFDADK